MGVTASIILSTLAQSAMAGQLLLLWSAISLAYFLWQTMLKSSPLGGPARGNPAQTRIFCLGFVAAEVTLMFGLVPRTAAPQPLTATAGTCTPSTNSMPRRPRTSSAPTPQH